MIPDSYDIVDLHKELKSERKAMAVRSSIFNFFLGVAYLLVGCFIWEKMVAPWNLLRQAAAFLIALVAWPLLLGGFDWINSLLLTRWPRCPVCRAKLSSFQPALRRCPKCHSRIVYDRRKLRSGYILPPPEAMRMRPPNPQSSSIGMAAGQSLLLFAIVVPTLLVSFFLFPKKGSMDVNIPRLTASCVTILGVFVIFCRFVGDTGVEKLLKLCVWIDRKCDKLNRKFDKNYRSVIPAPEHLCPHCHQEPAHRLAAVTGNCSCCGAPILETIQEPDTPEMMDWNHLHRYAKIQNIRLFYVPGVLLPFLLLLKNFQDFWLFWVIEGTLFLAIPLFWVMVVLRGLRRKWQLNFRCPECSYQNKFSNNAGAWRFLLQTGHCANCRRKLVRDDDPGKGDDHA